MEVFATKAGFFNKFLETMDGDSIRERRFTCKPCKLEFTSFRTLRKHKRSPKHFIGTVIAEDCPVTHICEDLNTFKMKDLTAHIFSLPAVIRGLSDRSSSEISEKIAAAQAGYRTPERESSIEQSSYESDLDGLDYFTEYPLEEHFRSDDHRKKLVILLEKLCDEVKKRRGDERFEVGTENKEELSGSQTCGLCSRSFAAEKVAFDHYASQEHLGNLRQLLETFLKAGEPLQDAEESQEAETEKISSLDRDDITEDLYLMCKFCNESFENVLDLGRHSLSESHRSAKESFLRNSDRQSPSKAEETLALGETDETPGTEPEPMDGASPAKRRRLESEHKIDEESCYPLPKKQKGLQDEGDHEHAPIAEPPTETSNSNDEDVENTQEENSSNQDVPELPERRDSALPPLPSSFEEPVVSEDSLRHLWDRALREALDDFHNGEYIEARNEHPPGANVYTVAFLKTRFSQQLVELARATATAFDNKRFLQTLPPLLDEIQERIATGISKRQLEIVNEHYHRIRRENPEGHRRDLPYLSPHPHIADLEGTVLGLWTYQAELQQALAVYKEELNAYRNSISFGADGESVAMLTAKEFHLREEISWCFSMLMQVVARPDFLRIFDAEELLRETPKQHRKDERVSHQRDDEPKEKAISSNFTNKQLGILDSYLNQQQKLNEKGIREVSRRAGLPAQTVMNWMRKNQKQDDPMNWEDFAQDHEVPSTPTLYSVFDHEGAEALSPNTLNPFSDKHALIESRSSAAGSTPTRSNHRLFTSHRRIDRQEVRWKRC